MEARFTPGTRCHNTCVATHTQAKSRSHVSGSGFLIRTWETSDCVCRFLANAYTFLRRRATPTMPSNPVAMSAMLAGSGTEMGSGCAVIPMLSR